MKKKIWLGVLGIVIIAISFFLYRLSKPPAAAPVDLGAETMLKFDVTRENLSKTIEVKGKSSYLNETFIYAPYSGDVVKWHVKDGTQLKKGDIMFELDGTKLSNDIALMEANSKKAQLEKRLNELQAAMSEHEAPPLTTEYESKKYFVEKEQNKIVNELNEVNEQINRTDIEEKKKKLGQSKFAAPDAGIFLFEDSSKIPQAVKESDRLGKIVDLGKLQLITYVGEQDVFQIKPGMPVKVKINALKNITLEGSVERVSKFAKSGTDQSSGQAAQFEVNIHLQPNENLIAGLSLTGEIEIANKENIVVVPTLAVQRENDKYYVMKQTPEGLEKTFIEIGLETADKTEVISGLNEGDKVVLQ